jgi:hypothetical protein
LTGANWTTATQIVDVPKCVWYGNTTDVSGVSKGAANTTGTDPQFTSGVIKGTDGETNSSPGTTFTSTGSNFSTVSTSDTLVVKAGSGASLGVYVISAVAPGGDNTKLTLATSPGASKTGITFGIVLGGTATNLSVGVNMKGLSAIALPGTGTTSYVDPGAAQRQEDYPTVANVLRPADGGPASYGNGAYVGTLEAAVIAGSASGSLTLSKESGANARGGSGVCAKLLPTSVSSYGYWHFYVPTTASTAFTLTFYYNATNGFNGYLKVTIYDTDQTTVLDSSRDVAGTYDGTWRQYAGYSVTPTATGFCLVRIEVIQGSHSGTDVIYIDDFGGV